MKCKLTLRDSNFKGLGLGKATYNQVASLSLLLWTTLVLRAYLVLRNSDPYGMALGVECKDTP